MLSAPRPGLRAARSRCRVPHGPECISICVNEFTRPHWCGNYAIAPEKCGIGPENSDSMWRQPGYEAVTDAGGCARGRLAQPGGLSGVASCPGLGMGAAAGPPLPGELLASSWISALRALQFSRAKRPFSGALAVGMASLGGFDPEFPVENGTRHELREPSGRELSTNQQGVVNGRLQKWPKA